MQGSAELNLLTCLTRFRNMWVWEGEYRIHFACTDELAVSHQLLAFLSLLLGPPLQCWTFLKPEMVM